MCIGDIKGRKRRRARINRKGGFIIEFTLFIISLLIQLVSKFFLQGI